MPKNMGSLDKTLRLVVAVVLVALAASGTIEGARATIAYVVAAVFVVTSLVSFCPLYVPLGMNTCGKD
ncbi:DUF2892 domain-containing protein [Aurantiacibacter xanthus]|uniref:DUF2892 domain-containing protein n=1 Tax=Aurantiacibacter xanthus TaxID=1784712 RepID=A0A3A1PA01_9SPHN|nr:DUF2892 domain-containing protein [Aurantiacibacter xanthus]RIV89538.1 DUF2892 domain-containing protein [Aurantiacibacter xanthus]